MDEETARQRVINGDMLKIYFYPVVANSTD